MFKKCSKCGTEHPLTNEFFNRRSSSKDGFRSECIACRKKENEENREVRSARKKIHYEKNKERIIQSVKDYYIKNCEKQKLAARKRYHRNSERRNALRRIWVENNRDSYLQKKREYCKKQYAERYGKDLEYTLNHRVRALLRSTIKRSKASRTVSSSKMIEQLGYTLEDLKAHLESLFTDGMTWDSVLYGDIHIDHIKPVSAFKIKDDQCSEFKECWALSNLQPLWAADNLSKGGKYFGD